MAGLRDMLGLGAVAPTGGARFGMPEPTAPLDQPNALSRGFNNAAVGGAAGKLNWEAELALQNGNTQQAVNLRNQAKLMGAEVTPSRKFTDFLPGGEAELGELPGYIGEGVGQGLHSAMKIIPAGAGGAGAAALLSAATMGRVPVGLASKLGGALGASTAGYNMNAEETAMQLANDPEVMANTTASERLGGAREAGALMSALDLAPMGIVANKVGKMVGKEGLAELAKKATLKDAALGFTGAMGAEALTGGGQAIVQQRGVADLATGSADGRPIDWADVTNNAAAEAIGGGGMHAITAGAGYGVGKAGAGGQAALDALGTGVDYLKGKAGDTYDQYAPDTVKAVGDGMKWTNDAVKQTAGYIQDLVKSAAENSPTGEANAKNIAGTLMADAEDLFSNGGEKLKSVFGKSSDQLVSGLEQVKDYVANYGDGKFDGAKESVELLTAIRNEGVAGFSKLPPATIEAVKRGIATVQQRLKSKRDDPAVQTNTATDAPYGDLSDAKFSKRGKGGDKVNKAVRNAMLNLKGLPPELIDRIANRINEQSVLKNGTSNISKTIRDAIIDTVRGIENPELAALFNSKTNLEYLTNEVKKHVEAPIQQHFDSVELDDGAIKTGVKEQMRPLIESLYYGEDMSDVELDELTDHYSTLVKGFAENTDSVKIDKFANLMQAKFGDRAEGAIQTMQEIAKNVYGTEDAPSFKALGRARTVGNIAGNMRQLLNADTDPKEVVPLMGKMLAQIKSGNYSENALRTLWQPLLKSDKSFSSAMRVLETFAKNPDSLTTENITRDNKKKMGAQGVNREGEASENDNEVLGENDSEDKVDYLGRDAIDPDKVKETRDRNNEDGTDQEEQPPVFHGHNAIHGKPSKEGEIQAPVSRYPSADFTNGSAFSRAIRHVIDTIGHRLADTEKVSVQNWAESESERTGQDELELYNKAMDTLIAEDAGRVDKLTELAKTNENAVEDLEWIKIRADYAKAFKENYGPDAGRRFFAQDFAKQYSYVRTKPSDAANVSFTLEKLRWLGPRETEAISDYLRRIVGGDHPKAKSESVEEYKARIKAVGIKQLAVKDSLIHLRLQDGKRQDLDFARLVEDTVKKHQQADVSGVTTSMKEAHLDPQSSDKDIERVLAGHQDFAKALLDSVHTVLGTLYLTKGVADVSNVEEGLVGKGKGSGAAKGGESFVTMGGMSPDTVVWRDFNTGLVIRYGQLSRFKGLVGDEARREKDPFTVTESDLAKLMPESNTKLGTDRVNVKGLVVEQRMVNGVAIGRKETAPNARIAEAAKAKAERGVAMRAVTGPDGKTHDLDVHGLLNHMLDQYGIDRREANHENVLPKELAAFLLNKGIAQLTSRGYKIDLTKRGEEGSVGSFRNSVMAFKGFDSDGGRYNVTLGNLRDSMESLRTTGQGVDTDLTSVSKKEQRVQLALVEKTIELTEKLRENKQADPELEDKYQRQLARREKLVEDIMWATGSPIEDKALRGKAETIAGYNANPKTAGWKRPAVKNTAKDKVWSGDWADKPTNVGLVGDGQIDLTSEFQGGRVVKQAGLKRVGQRSGGTTLTEGAIVGKDVRGETGATTNVNALTRIPDRDIKTGEAIDLRGAGVSAAPKARPLASALYDKGEFAASGTPSLPTSLRGEGAEFVKAGGITGPATKDYQGGRVGTTNVKPTKMEVESNASDVQTKRERLVAMREAKAALAQLDAHRTNRKGKAMAAAREDRDNLSLVSKDTPKPKPAEKTAAEKRAAAAAGLRKSAKDGDWSFHNTYAIENDKFYVHEYGDGKGNRMFSVIDKATNEEIGRAATQEEAKELADAYRDLGDLQYSRRTNPEKPDDVSQEDFDIIQEGLREHGKSLIGDLIKAINLILPGKLIDPATGERIAGAFSEKLNEIFVELSANSVADLNHEVWHKIEDVLQGMGPAGKEILNTIYKHMDTPLMKKWISDQMADAGVDGQLDSMSERAAFAFQLFMDDKTMPLPVDTKSIWNTIKNWVKTGLEKMGIKFTNEKQRTEAFFEFVKNGGFLRDVKNPEALLRAMGKERGDNIASTLKEVTKPLLGAVETVFGHTSRRLDKYKIDQYNKAVAMYVGAGGKDGYLERKHQMLNKWGNAAIKAIESVPEAVRGNFATTGAYREFMEELTDYLKAGTNLTDADITQLLENTTTYSQSAIDKNFKEFVQDLTTYGGLPEGTTPGAINEIASQIADMGYAEGDIVLFKGHGEILRKWQNFDPMEYMPRRVAAAVTKAERGRAFGRKDVNLKKLMDEGNELASPEARETATKVFNAFEGNLGKNMSMPMKTFTNAMLMVNNIRLLPFAVFSQTIEPLQIAFRSNKLGDSLDALWRGVKEARRTFDTLDKSAKKDYWENYALQAGTIAHKVLGDTVGQLYNGTQMRGFIGKANNLFFKYNFMQQWQRSMHVAATEAGTQAFIAHALAVQAKSGKTDKNGGLLAARQLKEAGLTAEEILENMFVAQDDGKTFQSLKLTPNIQRALNQFVAEAMAHPDAGSNPIWANDQRFALVSHMKRFSFAHARFILDRGVNELTNGNYAVLLPLLIAVPWMLMSDWLRDVIKPGDEAYKNDWGYTDYLVRGIDRSGVLGRGAIPIDAFRAESMGGRAMETAAGPTAELFGKLGRGAANGELLKTLGEENPMATLMGT